MNVNRYKLMILMGFAGILLADSRAVADQVQWDFVGTLYSVSGSGSSQPGVTVGATVTGSITLPDVATVYVSSSYPYWAGGTTTVFGGAYCNLDYTVASGGVLYHYVAGIGSLDMQITSNPSSQDNYHFWGGSAAYGFELGKSGPGVQRSGNFSSFLDGMAGGLGDGSGTITLTDVNSGTSVNGHLTSLTQTIISIPEPSLSSLLYLSALGALTLMKRRDGPAEPPEERTK
jgi:hypothetical protein